MAKGKKTGGKVFIKGDTRINRKGAPKIPDQIKTMSEILKNDAFKHLYKYWFLKLHEFVSEQKKADLTMGERMIAAAYSKAAKDGNLAYVEAILNRVMGKPINAEPTKVDVSMNNGPTVTFMVAEAEEPKKDGSE